MAQWDSLLLIPSTGAVLFWGVKNNDDIEIFLVCDNFENITPGNIFSELSFAIFAQDLREIFFGDNTPPPT